MNHCLIHQRDCKEGSACPDRLGEMAAECSGIDVKEGVLPFIEFCHSNNTAWHKHDDPPQAEHGKWSREVVVLTNLGDVFLVSYFGTKDSGTWQRPHRFNPGEKVEWWIDKPKP